MGTSPSQKSEESYFDVEEVTVGVVGEKAEPDVVALTGMKAHEIKQWCMFLQERVVSEIYSLAISERNQQALCQVGLPQRILMRCHGVLADEAHPLHQALERTFEKLSYQALTPSDFRQFLRLGNPLCCYLNDVTLDELSSGKFAAYCPKGKELKEGEDPDVPPPPPFGGSLSLARIQSLVSMTTPRDGFQPVIVGAPPFVEFDLSIDGFGCLFLPSVFPISEPTTAQNAPTQHLSTSGVGEGGRSFPSHGGGGSGLTFTCWVLITKYAAEDHTSRLTLLTLSQTLSVSDTQVKHFPILRIYLKLSEQNLCVSTHQSHEDPASSGVAMVTEEESRNTTMFECEQLFLAQSWNHVAVVMHKPALKGKAKATLYINGQSMGTQKMSHVHILHSSSLSPQPSDPNQPVQPVLINAHIGTHVTSRHVSMLTYRMGPTFLIEEHLSANVIGTMFRLGPSYLGSFQAPIVQDLSSPSSTHGHALPPLIAEEKLLFGLIATHPLTKTIHELDKMYTLLDVTAIRRELSLSEHDDVTPVTLLHNTAVHLSGPSRTLGAVMCGYSGIRFFQPQPLRSLLSSVGGTRVVLGLVAMATTVDNLYASMKALVCIVGNNQVALREMERTGGFKVLGMLLRSKSHLINSNILHLTYTLVGTVDSEQESACIPNLIAFQDLLADLAVWSTTSEDIQRSLFSHFFDLLSHTSHKYSNADLILNMKMVSLLLFRLLDDTLTIRTIKAVCNVISALLGIQPRSEDIQRVGQLLATTLPSNQKVNENTISLYEDDEGSTHSDCSEHAQFGRFRGDEGKQQRAIVLRNILLDVLISLLTRDLEVNHQFASELYQSLGFDWLFLFMHATIHTETVVRAVRILVQLLSDNSLRLHFLNGDIFGGWTKGFESISMEMTNLVVKSLTYLNPFQFSPSSSSSQQPPQLIPGPSILANLLPSHSEFPQIYLLLSANMLGCQCTDIPFNARFDMETLEEVFHIGDPGVMRGYRVSGEAACVLLTVARTLLHKDPSDAQLQENAVVLVKFFERLYKTLPEFRKLAATSEFIDSLVGTLFPPTTYQEGGIASVSDMESLEGGKVSEEKEGDDWIVVDTDVIPGTGGKEDGDAILNYRNNLAVCTILKLLRTIAIDGFSSAQPMTKDLPASCPILERVLSATPPGMGQRLIREYQTRILLNMMDHLQKGSEDIMVVFREGVLGANLDRSLCGLSVFCSRVVDKVWQNVFQDSTQSVYTFLFWMVEQARKTPKQMPLMDLQRSLNRLILFQVSNIPTTEVEQKAFMDTLCMYSSQAHVIFDETNVEDQFLECLTYCLLKIALYEKYLTKNPLLQKMDSMTEEGATKGVDTSSLHGKVPSGYVPGSLAMMKSGANRLWTKMLEHKKADLDRLLQVELPYPGDNHHNREALVGHQIPHQTFSTGNRTFLRLQNCHLFLTDNLERVWRDFVAEEKSIQSLDAFQQRDSIVSSAAASTIKKGTGLVAAMASKVRKKSRAVISKDELVNEFVSVLCHLMILLSQKFYELLLRKHQRNVEYSLRFAALEWSKIEYELTRERGLWGPDKSSPLDKWMVDTVEGPCRMRKRLQRNHEFFKQYPFQPRLTTAVKSKYHKPSSSDSELQAIRDRLFQRPTILATPTTHLTATPRGNEAAAKAPTETTGATSSGSVPVYGPSSNTIFNHPDSDDPIAQTLYKMIEPDDKVTKQYQCARLTGLDSRDGVLLLGSTHFYVIEGITITRTGGMMDIESVPRDLYEPVVPGNIHPHAEKVDQEIPIECMKWSYDTVREIHKRRYLLRHCAIEVFSSDGRSHFLIFHPKYRDKIYQKLVSLSKSSLTQGDSHYIAGIHPEMDPEHSQGIFSVLTGERSLVEKWVNGEMSNFQYLMHLNTLAGRSYNDLMQYPIFPWILADYSSENLDLTNPKTFRDLSKPMGALNEQRLSRFIERYRYFEDPTGENTPPYYYGTHYSSAMIVASYLIRMEPFTQYFLKLQGGHFDLPDRLFHSIPDAWRSASESNMADVKELIPEFFYLPEFLSNSNNFELGTKQSGETLGSIILPPWSKGDPQEFIRVHREALECDYVSANLHKWIDLIFGYKQKGEEALASHNVFHHLFYEGAVDIDKIEDPMKRNAAISFIHNFGQMPKQLFKKPHRQRKILTTPLSQDAPAATPTNLVDSQRVFYKNLVRLMPSKEPLRIIPDKVNQIVCPDQKFPLAVDNNKIFLSWGNYKYYFNWGFPDHSARIATVDQDKIVSMFEGLHQGRILCAAIADDATLLTGGESTVVCVWEIGSGGGKERLPSKLHLKHTLHGHTAPICCLSTSLTYNLIVSGSRDKTCILWDMTNFSFVRQLCDHSGPVTAVAINQLNGNIVSCTKNQIRLWTVNGTQLAETPLMLSSNVKVLCCAVSELFDWDKDNVIITGSSDGIVRMWCLEYVSEEEMLQNTKIRRGSPADSMLSGVSGGESVLDFTAPRDRLASHVVDKLKKATLSTGGTSSRHRSKSSPLHHADVLSLDDDELFRSTGQLRHSSPSKQSATSAELSDGADSALGGMAMASSLPGEGMSKVSKSLLRTLSQDEEEERTVGSGTDLLTEDAYYPSGTSPTPSGGMTDQGEEFEARDGAESESPQFVMGGEELGSRDQNTVDGGNRGSKELGVASDEEKGVSSDKDMGGAEKQEKGVAEEKQLTEMEKLAELNPAYAKYIMEKKKASEELRLRTGKWFRRLKLVHTLTMHTSFHRKDNDKPAAVTSLCISKDHRKLFIGDSIGRIFSWTVTDNLGGVMQHWVNDSAVNSCYNCKVEFTTFERKHHCRDCGQIFCAKCSNFEGEVERLRIHKKVRVCALCFEKNHSEKQRLFRSPSDIDAV